MKYRGNICIIAITMQMLRVCIGNQTQLCFIHGASSLSSSICQISYRNFTCNHDEKIAINHITYHKPKYNISCDQCYRQLISNWTADLNILRNDLLKLCQDQSSCTFDGVLSFHDTVDLADGAIWYAIVEYQCVKKGHNDCRWQVNSTNNYSNDVSAPSSASDSGNLTDDCVTVTHPYEKDILERYNAIDPKLIASVVGGIVAFVLIALFVYFFLRRHFKETSVSTKRLNEARTQIMMENMSNTSKHEALNTVNVVDIGSEETKSMNSTLPKNQKPTLSGHDSTCLNGKKETEHAVIVEPIVETGSDEEVSSEIDLASDCELTRQSENTVHAYSTLSGDDDYSHIPVQGGIQMNLNMSEYSHLNHLQRTIQGSDYNTLLNHGDSGDADTHKRKQSKDSLYDHTSL